MTIRMYINKQIRAEREQREAKREQKGGKTPKTKKGAETEQMRYIRWW